MNMLFRWAVAETVNGLNEYRNVCTRHGQVYRDLHEPFLPTIMWGGLEG